MSRHRNVRSMNYSEEYDGYDDVYGHSVEDDYCVSPSEAAFMYDREGSKNNQKIGAFFQTVTDIAEENEGELESKESSLSDIDRARLESCLEQMKQTVGSAVPRQDLVNILLMYNFNIEKAVNFIFDSPQYKDVKPPERKEKDANFVTTKLSKSFAIPKLNGINPKCPTNLIQQRLTNSNFSSLDELAKNHLDITKPPTPDKGTNFGTLADLTSHHLNAVNFNSKPIFGKPLFPQLISSNNSDRSKIDKLSSSISSLTLSKKLLENKASAIKSESGSNKDCVDNDWHIDLTKALRSATSAPLLQPKGSSASSPPTTESFVPDFVDCETELEQPQVLSRFCNMDISWILAVKNANSKKASKFGKVLCRRYKRSKPYFVRTVSDYLLTDITPFLFDSPSPDDIISEHLRK